MTGKKGTFEMRNAVVLQEVVAEYDDEKVAPHIDGQGCGKWMQFCYNIERM